MGVGPSFAREEYLKPQALVFVPVLLLAPQWSWGETLPSHPVQGDVASMVVLPKRSYRIQVGKNCQLCLNPDGREATCSAYTSNCVDIMAFVRFDPELPSVPRDRGFDPMKFICRRLSEESRSLYNSGNQALLRFREIDSFCRAKCRPERKVQEASTPAAIEAPSTGT